eukprot:1989419-Amphidinium_carterae.1
MACMAGAMSVRAQAKQSRRKSSDERALLVGFGRNAKVFKKEKQLQQGKPEIPPTPNEAHIDFEVDQLDELDDDSDP